MAKRKIVKRIQLVKLLTNDGILIDKEGWMDFTNGVYDSEGSQNYALGFEIDGTVHGNNGDVDTGDIFYEDGLETGYNINENYFSLICLRVVYNKFKLVA